MPERTFAGDVQGCKSDLRAASRHYSPTVVCVAAQELARDHCRRAAEWAYHQRFGGAEDDA